MNQYEQAELNELEDQAEYLRRLPPVGGMDGWELATRILATLLMLDFIALLLTWK